MNTEKKRLYRSRSDKVLGGVCGGLGEYLDVDPVLIRVAWAAMVLLKGFGILLYIIWIFVVPLRPYSEGAVRKERRGGTAGIVFGSVLVFLGVVFLADEWRWIDLHLWGGWSWNYFLPVLLMAGGVWFLLRSRDEKVGADQESSDAGATKVPGEGRRFVREQEGKKIFGVCGGIGAYMGIDATIVRLLFVLLTLLHPPIGILTYLALAVFTPVQDGDHQSMGTRTS